MKSSNELLSDIKHQIEVQIQQSYLEKFIQKPVIDDDKLWVLSSVIDNTSYSDTKKKKYIITTMLVQIALDTHDLVTETKDDESDHSRKQRQLTVLAGDYFSGLYYGLLSQINDIAMIHTLASAIKEINELKMKLYYKKFNTVQAFMDTLKQIEALLIWRVSEFIHQSSINEVTGEWLLARRLISEKNSYYTKGFSPIFKLITKGPAFNVNDHLVVDTVDRTIENSINLVEKSLDQLPQNFSSLKQYVDEIIQDNFENSKVMEEG